MIIPISEPTFIIAHSSNSWTMHTQGDSEWISTRDGRKLYAQVLNPSSRTTVIFECGAGATRSTFGLLQPRVASFARAVVYDRSGMGQSPSDTDRSLKRMSEDLCDVIDHFRDTSDAIVLVGHSAGGLIIRLAAALRPVSALVLLDPTDEGVDALFAPSFRYIEKIALYAGLGMAYTGLMRPIGARAMKWMLDLMPEDVRSDLEKESFVIGVIHTQMAVSATFIDEVRALRTSPPIVPDDVKVTIVSGTQGGFGMSESVRKEFNAAHERQAARYKLGRHAVAPDSGHMLIVQDVQLIVDEIKRVVE